MSDIKKQRISEILNIMQEYNIKLEDIKNTHIVSNSTPNSVSKIIKFLICFGSLLIFTGAELLIYKYWQLSSPFERVLYTYGLGLLLIILGLMLFKRRADSLIYDTILTIGTVLQMLGLIYISVEWWDNNQYPHLLTMLISSIMFLQTLIIWLYTKSNILLFILCIFGTVPYFILAVHLQATHVFNEKILNVSTSTITRISISISIILMAYIIHHTHYKNVAKYIYFLGAAILYITVGLEFSETDLMFLSIITPLIGLVVGTWIRSKSLAIISAIALVWSIYGIIGAEWSRLLIILGLGTIIASLYLYQKSKLKVTKNE